MPYGIWIDIEHLPLHESTGCARVWVVCKLVGGGGVGQDGFGFVMGCWRHDDIRIFS